MRVRYTLPASRGLDRLLDYIADHSPQGATEVQRRLQEMVAMLADFPEAGQKTGRRNTRRLVIVPFPYLIFYRVSGDEVIIDAIRHAARKPVV